MRADELRTIKEEEGNLKGKRVLVRAGFNVPIKDGEIENDFRIRKTLPTIAWLKGEGAKIILISHIWGDETTSLEVVYRYLKKHMELQFAADFEDEKLANMKEGDVVLCENLRLHEGEQANDAAFAQQLAELGDVYVNDAFSVSHREHASIVGIPEHIPSFAGLRMIEEVSSLSRAFEPEHPFVFVLGGAKFSTKIPVVSKFLNEADNVYVGGALAHPYLESRGFDVGSSLVDKDDTPLGTAPEDERLVIPEDMVSVEDGRERVLSRDELSSAVNIQDVGPQTLASMCDAIQEAAMVIWNGPLGNYENGYYETTQEFARALSESGAVSIIGGGDTLAAISELDIEESFDFVSTGGGAMLSFLLQETLPGLEVLRK